MNEWRYRDCNIILGEKVCDPKLEPDYTSSISTGELLALFLFYVAKFSKIITISDPFLTKFAPLLEPERAEPLFRPHFPAAVPLLSHG